MVVLLSLDRFEISPNQSGIALDNLGCGLSDKPLDYDYCLANHTTISLRLIDTLDTSRILLWYP